MKRRARSFKWTKKKPTKPCVFVTREELTDDLTAWALYAVVPDAASGEYMVTNFGTTKEPLRNFEADEYMVIEEFPNDEEWDAGETYY